MLNTLATVNLLPCVSSFESFTFGALVRIFEIGRAFVRECLNIDSNGRLSS